MATENKAGKSKKKEPPPAAEGTGASKGKDKTAVKEKKAAELATELNKLRAMLKEIVKLVSLRIDDQIADALRVLEQKPAPGQSCALPGARASSQLAKKLHGVKIKSGKGKLKDIARIKQLMEKITEKIPKKS